MPKKAAKLEKRPENPLDEMAALTALYQELPSFEGNAVFRERLRIEEAAFLALTRVPEDWITHLRQGAPFPFPELVLLEKSLVCFGWSGRFRLEETLARRKEVVARRAREALWVPQSKVVSPAISVIAEAPPRSTGDHYMFASSTPALGLDYYDNRRDVYEDGTPVPYRGALGKWYTR